MRLLRSKLEHIKTYLQVSRGNNRLFKDLFKIVVAYEANQQKQEELIREIKDLMKLVQLDSIEKLEPSSNNAQIRAHLLKKYNAKNAGEALAKVIPFINNQYNPCITPGEMQLDLQSCFLAYCHNNQNVIEKLRSLEANSKIQGHETQHIEQLYERLHKEEIELREHLAELRPKFDNAEYKNIDKTSIVNDWLATKRLIEDKLNHLYNVDDLLNKIEEIDKYAFNNGLKEYPDNKPLVHSSGQKEITSISNGLSRSERDYLSAR